MDWPFALSASITPARRALRLRGGVVYPAPTIGTLLVVDALSPVSAALVAIERGALRDPALLTFCAVLSLPWRDAQRLAGTRRLAWRAWRVRPRTLEEAAALAGWYVGQTETPDRFRDADEAKRAAHTTQIPPASSAPMRLALRVAALGGAPEALAGVRTVLDVPVRDTVAWLMAADELEGAHFLGYETYRRMEEAYGTGEA